MGMSSTQTTRRDAHPMHAGPRMLLGSLERNGYDDYAYIGRTFGTPKRGEATHAVLVIDCDNTLWIPLDAPTGCWVRTEIYDAGNSLVGSYDSEPFSVLRALETLRNGASLLTLTDYRG